MILFLKHVKTEGPGTILDFVIGEKYPFKILELWQGDLLPNKFNNISAVVSLGGPMNVYEGNKYRFLLEEDTFIKEVINRGIPFLGVCLGSQLLAKAANSKIYKGPEEEIGWFKVKLTSNGERDPIFKDVLTPLDVFQWHGDTFDIPKNGILLACGNPVINQAFRVGKCAYGFQFHVEIDEGVLKRWFKRNVLLKEYLAYQRIIKENYNKMARKIYENFFGLKYGGQ